MPAPQFDWAEPSHLGRFGIYERGEPILCADGDCQRFAYTAHIEEQHPHGSLPLLWEDGKTGQIYHYRCAPQVEKDRYALQERYASLEESLAGMRRYIPRTVPCQWRGAAHGITGDWIVVGARFGPDPAGAAARTTTYTLLLWSRDGQQRLL